MSRAGLALGCLTALAAAGCGASHAPPGAVVSAGVAVPFVHRSELIEPVPAPAFTLTDQSGTPCRMGDLRGDVVAIGFVYSTCPDICGQVRAAFLAVQEKFAERIGAGLDLLLVSTDPVGDTPARIATYTEVFHGRWRYLTGTEAALRPVWDAFRVQVRGPGTDGRIDHTWMIALVDRRGDVRFRYFGQDNPRDTLIPDITALLEEVP